jgi:hypothetical protein
MSMSPEELERRRAAANPPKDPDAELLVDGQEEVFSRTEVETGRIEHHTVAGIHAGGEAGAVNPRRSTILRDEDQTERQAPANAGPGEPAGG